MRRARFPTAAAALASLALAGALVAYPAAGRADSGAAQPWSFADDYRSLAYVDLAATTAVVDTSGTGSVRLPTAPAGLALDPAASVGVVAGPDGIQAWAFDGSAMVRAPQLDLAGTGFVGAAWLGVEGNLLATATAAGIQLEGWNGTAWSTIAALPLPGIAWVAPGPSVAGTAASVLVGGPSGAGVIAYQHGTLTVQGTVLDAAGLSGLAATADGSLAYLLTAGGSLVFAWDGSRYRELPTWELPAGSVPTVAAAWFRSGAGYWLLLADGSLEAYGFDGSSLVSLPQLSGRLDQPVLALATGWADGELAALTPTGWHYLSGSPLTVDAARSVAGLSLPAYQRSAVLQSTTLSPGEALAELQLDAVVTSLPAGTTVAYQVSSDGGASWVDAPACVNPADPGADCAGDNFAAPPGGQLIYRLLLATADPSQTPVVDATAIYAIASVTWTDGAWRTVLVR